MVKDLLAIESNANEIWVDYVTGAADVSEPTPVHARVIGRLAKLVRGSLEVGLPKTVYVADRDGVRGIFDDEDAMLDWAAGAKALLTYTLEVAFEDDKVIVLRDNADIGIGYDMEHGGE